MPNTLTARELGFQKLNEKVRELSGEITINECFGERFIASGARDKTIVINGTPGNALGCYLDGAEIIVNGNAQDAVGDTMNDGRIIVHGNAGDALGYAMRGGAIYIKGSSGYRTGIHMKEYKEKAPVIVIGEKTGSFLGEYVAGGLIIVLGIGCNGAAPIGHFTGTGMHGGRIFLRCDSKPDNLPVQVVAEQADSEDIAGIESYIRAYASFFKADAEALLGSKFYKLTPNAKNPYKQMYTAN